jgi:hypothetical protein
VIVKVQFSVDYETQRGSLAKLLNDYTRQWGTLHWKRLVILMPKLIQLTITEDVQTEPLEWL